MKKRQDEKGKGGKSPREKALVTYVWFLFSLLVFVGVFGVIFPDLIKQLRVFERQGGDVAELFTRIGKDLRAHGVWALLPAGLATVLWLSPMSREAVHRVLYTASLLIGLALIGGSVALYLDFFG